MILRFRAKTYILKLITSGLLVAIFSVPAYPQNQGTNKLNQYIGSDACGSCHPKEHQLWQQSHHHKAMQTPSIATVIGNFNNTEVEFHGIKTRFFKNDNNYFVETTNKDGHRQTFEVKYTFGFSPLQQYILDTGKGHLQAFNIAWDTRPTKEGGQRWYHLQPRESITPDHPFFWQRHYQNWNSRCAECHTTGYEKNYQLKSNSFTTQFSEATVGCESCHGPAKTHQQQAELGNFSKNKGFAQTQYQAPVWRFAINDPIANLVSGGNDQYMKQCSSCHSRRLPIGKNIEDYQSNNEEGFHDQFVLDLLSPQTYFADGQINEEVFVLGSFLQSKMAQAGVTCSNCHNPHSGKLTLEGNQVCTQCHIASSYDSSSHHFHQLNSEGAKCVECHMPTRTYMQVDKRRDHSFVLPNAQVSSAVNSPNACLTCHTAKDISWVSQYLEHWSKKRDKTKTNHWSLIHTMSDDRKNDFAKTMIAIQPAIVGAKFLEIINARPSQASVNLALQQLSSKEPMIRRGAIGVLRKMPPKQALQYIIPLLKDPVKSVRFDAISLLVSHLDQIPKKHIDQALPAIEEYRASLMVTADFPSSHIKLGQLALAQGDIKKAEQHFEYALAIAPNLPMVMLAFADFCRKNNNQSKEFEILKKAVRIHPDFSDVLHQYGLFWVRKKEYSKASGWLIKANEQIDSKPHYAYVAASALDTINKTQAAVELLLQANKRWPKQINLLHSLALYAIKTKNDAAIKLAISELKILLPDNPQVRQWIRVYL